MSGNIASSLCISASASQSTLLVSVASIIGAWVAADWIWVEAVVGSRGRGRDEDAWGDEGDGASISRKRSSIAASETASASWG